MIIMKSKTKTNTYLMEDAQFKIDVEQDPCRKKLKHFWIYHKHYGIKTHMFSGIVEDIEEEERLVEDNADFHRCLYVKHVMDGNYNGDYNND